jgi:hypothetical protein
MFMGVERSSFWKGFLTFIKITLFSLSALPSVPLNARQRGKTTSGWPFPGLDGLREQLEW